jgi:hypothetical protein
MLQRKRFALTYMYMFTVGVAPVILPVRIRVRIDPPHPLVCRKRRLNGAVLQMRPEKPRSRVTAGDPSLLKGPERRA